MPEPFSPAVLGPTRGAFESSLRDVAEIPLCEIQPQRLEWAIQAMLIAYEEAKQDERRQARRKTPARAGS